MTVITAVRTTVAAALIALPLAGAATAAAAMDAHATAAVTSVHVQPADTPWGPDDCACGTGS